MRPLDAKSAVVRSADRYAEDLDANLRMVERLAPVHCVACHGYHLARARKRLRPEHADMLDRPQIVALVREHGAHRLNASATGIVDLLIAGNGDTNLLSACAEALSELDPTLARLRITAIDSCQTPLELCKAYARDHAIDLRAERIDMTTAHTDYSVDLILVHSLLRFAPADTHIGIMRRLARWLRADGVMIFSHRLMPPHAANPRSAYRAEYQTSQQLRALFAEAGWRAISLETFDEVDGRQRHRLLAVLAAG